MTEPATKTSPSGPTRVAPEFAEHHAPTGFEHSGYLPDGPLRLANEAEHRHYRNDIEPVVLEWQGFSTRFVQFHLHRRVREAAACGFEHARIWVDRRNAGAGLRKCQRELTVTTTNVEDTQSGHRTDQTEDEILLQVIGDAPQAAGAPSLIGGWELTRHAGVAGGPLRHHPSPLRGPRQQVRQALDDLVDFIRRRRAPETEPDGPHADLGGHIHRLQHG
jgi:hypothetical protein